MKPLPLKIDNYLLERITEEARGKGLTKAEVVRSALIHYLIYKEDLEEVHLIRERLGEPDLPESKVHARLKLGRSRAH